MGSTVRGRVRRPTSPRTARIVCLIFIVAGLGLAAWGAWSLAGAVGPRTTSTAHAVALDHYAGGYHSPETWTVHVAWDGGSGSIESEDLYNALFPLEGQPSVTAERSAVTGDVLRVELGGSWYVAPETSIPGALLRVAIGLLLAGFAAFYFARFGRAIPGRASSARADRIALVLIAGFFTLGLGALVLNGAQGMLENVGPRTTSSATVVDAANSYVDLSLDGTTDRVTNSDLEESVSIDLELNTTFGNADPLLVRVERSSVDGSIEQVTYDGQSYDVGPEIINPLAELIVGLFGFGLLVYIVVRVRMARIASGAPVGAADPVAAPVPAAPLAAADPTTVPAPISEAAGRDVSAYGRIAGRIEVELRRLGWWSASPPAEAPAGPFGEANATFTQWLQFVLCPRLREVAAGTAPAPQTSNVSTKAVREFDGQPETDTLIDVLSDLDHLVDA